MPSHAFGPSAHSAAGAASVPSSKPPARAAPTPPGAYPASRADARSEQRLRLLGRMDTSQLSDAVNACVQSGDQPCPVFMNGYIDHLSVFRLRHMRPRQLVAVISSLVEMDYHPGDDWLHDFDVACNSHVGPLDPESVSQLLKALMSYPDVPYRFPQAVYVKLKQHMEDFNFQQLCSILQCLQRMKVSMEEEVLEAAGKRMAALLDDMDSESRSAAFCRLLEDQQAQHGGEA